jgi:hypothetical protein
LAVRMSHLDKTHSRTDRDDASPSKVLTTHERRLFVDLAELDRNARTTRSQALLELLQDAWRRLWTDAPTAYLGNATSDHDLERRQRDWDEVQHGARHWHL